MAQTKRKRKLESDVVTLTENQRREFEKTLIPLGDYLKTPEGKAKYQTSAQKKSKPKKKAKK